MQAVRGGRGPAAGKMTSPLAATLGSSGDVAAGFMDSGGPGVALPCASVRRSRVFPEFLMIARMLVADTLFVLDKCSGK